MMSKYVLFAFAAVGGPLGWVIGHLFTGSGKGGFFLGVVAGFIVGAIVVAIFDKST